MSNPPSDLRLPYTPRRAASELHDRLIVRLAAQPAVGAPFLTDAEVVAATGLSRSTVRRALDDLQREGWVDRRIGQGTFVGPRAAAPATPSRSSDPEHTPPTVRLAVLIYSVGDLAHDWYTPLVLEGLDRAATECGISVELLGTRDRDADAISRRIAQTFPDVVACLTNDPREAFVLRDAQRLGIPCIVTGTPHMRLGMPCVCEDNRQGMRLAVELLRKRGHHRIGLALQRQHEPWVFERHESFVDALRPDDRTRDDACVHWLPLGPDDAVTPNMIDGMQAFIQNRGLTALISGSRLAMTCVDQLMAARRLHVPHDLSIVSFEQERGPSRWAGALRPTWVDLALPEIGCRVAHLARNLADKRAVPDKTVVPCCLREGDSVGCP